ncbi:LysR family transcriptional regulator [uncultured Roseibium sp.]|uniref:LysR family transcriptional regulator n=1 Tax=uncultured Roseibium sp. TaxID=1936171 RepID=UPI003216C356
MTFEQLTIFVAVAEREHLTRAAETLHLTPSAVSSAIRKLEDFYGVQLFDRVGRGLAITAEGRLFLDEARATLTRMQSAERFLGELGGLQRGVLAIAASQTIASYWLPGVLMGFHTRYPGIELSLAIGNTETVSKAVETGAADIGYVEGELENPLLRKRHIANDALMIVTSPGHPLSDSRLVTPQDLIDKTAWVLREPGSGTRSAFEAAMEGLGVAPSAFDVVMELPSNEAVLSAVRSSRVASAVSSVVAAPWIAAGGLARVNFELPARSFTLLSHKERHLSRAAEQLLADSLSVR